MSYVASKTIILLNFQTLKAQLQTKKPNEMYKFSLKQRTVLMENTCKTAFTKKLNLKGRKTQKEHR